MRGSMLLKRAATLLVVLLHLATSTSAADEPAATVAYRQRYILVWEKATLLALKRGLTLPSPSSLADWNESNGHVCRFTGVTCDRRRIHVVGLDLANMGISGAIPEVIGDLSHLRSLDVSNNSFSGVPASIGNLTRLRRLFMNNNSISGTILPVITNLSQLRDLDVSYNHISGVIPPSFGNLTGLDTLEMSNNNITGHIPAELSNLRNISVVDLSSNQLYGEIPPSLSELTSMFYFSLHHNNLSGLIPAAIFMNCTIMGVFDLGNNGLSGEIPSMASSDTLATTFAVLNLYSNKLTGKLPRWLANCSTLYVLDVENNLLDDELPTSIVSGKKYLRYLHLSNNHFRSHDGNNNLEPFFAALWNCSWLQDVDAGGVGTREQLPSWLVLELSSFLRIVLSHNALTGEIPPSIGNLTNLGELDLSDNMLSGSIPSSIEILDELRVLSLQRNRLRGQIPLASLGSCTNLIRVDLSSNLLTGSLTAGPV
ncbi:unnamed protein product [Urochloa humidicola]